MDANGTIKTSGDIKDVASFFCVSTRTVLEWKDEDPPRLRFFQEGRNICFGEEAIIEYRVKKTRNSGRMLPGEAEQIAKKEWREHLKVRSEEVLAGLVEELQRRLERLEAERIAA